MGKTTGFIEFQRKTHGYDSVAKRKKNFDEFIHPLSKKAIQEQGARCMDCGVPFCHQGCPLGNIIPDFNHYLYTGDMRAAFETLLSTNNFPDVTGRVCPAPCESACVLGINKPSVAIKSIEYSIAEEARKKRWLNKPRVVLKKNRTGKRVAIVGSGPAGLACADQLNQVGHHVTVFERADQIGGLLTYGIPNFKLDKKIVFDHVKRMTKEGIVFKVNVEVGKDINLDKLENEFDAIVLAVGSTIPRDLNIPNRDVKGIYQAMDFLTESTQSLLNKRKVSSEMSAYKKRVLVIGGGDTGSDCIGTSIRQGASKVIQIEILPKPLAHRDETMPWPLYERIFRVSSSQEEGCHRDFNILTKRFIQNQSHRVTGIEYVKVEWDQSKKTFQEKQEIKTMSVDMVLLAMGFVGAEKNICDVLSLPQDSRGRIQTQPTQGYDQVSYGNIVEGITDFPLGHRTGKKNIFVAGDARRGQSLVVWAISEGRECAREVDVYLRDNTHLLSKNNWIYTDSLKN